MHPANQELFDRNRRAARLAGERGWLDTARIDALIKLGEAWGQDLVEGALQASWLTPAQADELRGALGVDDTEPAAPLPARMPRHPGEILGGYEVVRRLGAGAMGTVFEGKHLQAGVYHALKIVQLEGQSQEHVERFVLEGQALGRVSHPAVVRVHSCEVLPGNLGLLAMDRVPGENLERLLEPGPLPIDQALRIGAQLARALEALHAAGIVHRDLKPANVIIHEESGQPVLCDFGVVHDLFRSTRLTQTGQLLGSPLYMAPEQILGEREAIGPATDVFSLGVILYRSLSGHPPFDADSLVGLAGRILDSRPEGLRSLRPDLPRAAARRIDGALAKRPEDRPSAGALADDLERIARGEWLVGPPPLALLALPFALLALAALAWVSFPGGETVGPPPVATDEAPAEPEPTPPTPREAALTQVLGGEAHDPSLLTPDERQWATLERDRRALDEEIGSLGSDATYYQAASRRLDQALDLGELQRGMPPTETLTKTVRERLALTLLNVILDVPRDLKKAETVKRVLAMATRLLPPGDSRPDLTLKARRFYLLQGQGDPVDLPDMSPYGTRWVTLATSMHIVRDSERGEAFLRWVPAFEPLDPGIRGHLEIGLTNRACRFLGDTFETIVSRSLEAEAAPNVLLEQWETWERFNRAGLIRRRHLGINDGEVLTGQVLQQVRVWLLAGDPTRAREALQRVPPSGRNQSPEAIALHQAEVFLLEGKLEEAGDLIDDVPRDDAPPLLAAIAHARGEASPALATTLVGEPSLSWRSVAATRRMLESGRDPREPLWQARRDR